MQMEKDKRVSQNSKKEIQYRVSSCKHALVKIHKIIYFCDDFYIRIRKKHLFFNQEKIMKPYSFDSFDQSSALRTKTKISNTYYTFIIEIKNNYIQ